MQKKCFFLIAVIIVIYLVASTSSEPVDNNYRLTTQEGKQTSQEPASTSKRPSSNQALVKNVGCYGGRVPSSRIQKKVVLLSIGLAQNSAVGVRGRI